MKTILKEQILKPMRVLPPLYLDEVDGMRTIANSQNLFSQINNDFNDWYANEPGPSTEETEIDIYETIGIVRLNQIFCSLGSDLHTLCLTQHQIINFIENYGNHYLSVNENFFLSIRYGTHHNALEYLVINVSLDVEGSPCADVLRFGDCRAFDSSEGIRVIVPRVITL
jgi:hypothetical protein